MSGPGRRRRATAGPPSRGGAVRRATAEIDALRVELERRAGAAAGPARWNADPEQVERSVAKLVLTLMEFLRKLFEKQAIRRMDAGTLSPGETEALGLALMRLEDTIKELAGRFDLSPEELNLDLGPLGRLT